VDQLSLILDTWLWTFSTWYLKISYFTVNSQSTCRIWHYTSLGLSI